MGELMDGLRHINQYIDGRMGPDERERFEATLTTLPELADELEHTREAIELLRALPFAPAPADLTARIMGEVRQRPVPLRSRLADLLTAHLRRPAMVAFAGAMTVVVALVGANLVGGPGETSAPLVAHRSQVRLSHSDSQFVSDCFADYQVVSVSAAPTRQPAREE